MGVFHKAWCDTLGFFEWRPRLAILPLLLAFGALIHSRWAERPDQPLEEIMIWLTYSFVPVVAFAVLIFLWNLAAAPYRLERQARQKAEGTISDLGTKVTDLHAQLEETKSSKAKIRAALDAINPAILASIDTGGNGLYIVASELKFHRLLEECDNPRGRQLVAGISQHGIDMGHQNSMREGDPFRDSVVYGTKHHFTLTVHDALKA